MLASLRRRYHILLLILRCLPLVIMSPNTFILRVTAKDRALSGKDDEDVFMLVASMHRNCIYVYVYVGCGDTL